MRYRLFIQISFHSHIRVNHMEINQASIVREFLPINKRLDLSCIIYQMLRITVCIYI